MAASPRVMRPAHLTRKELVSSARIGDVGVMKRLNPPEDAAMNCDNGCR